MKKLFNQVAREFKLTTVDNKYIRALHNDGTLDLPDVNATINRSSEILIDIEIRENSIDDVCSRIREIIESSCINGNISLDSINDMSINLTCSGYDAAECFIDVSHSSKPTLEELEDMESEISIKSKVFDIYPAFQSRYLELCNSQLAIDENKIQSEIEKMQKELDLLKSRRLKN